MTYSVLYDVSRDTVPISLWLALFLGLAVIGTPVVISLRRSRLPQVALPLAALVWASCWASVIYVQSRALSSCRHRLQAGAVEVVQGTVQNFVPMPYLSNGLESFVVSGVPFSYSDFDLSQCGFRNTTSHGGPIRPGLPVRITYSGNSILRLEAALPPSQPKSGA